MYITCTYIHHVKTVVELHFSNSILSVAIVAQVCLLSGSCGCRQHLNRRHAGAMSSLSWICHRILQKSSYVLHSNFDAQSLCRREKGFQDEHYPARWRLVEWFNAWPANDIIEAAPRDDPGAVQTVPGKRKRNRANDPGCDRLLHANRNELNA